MMNLIEDKWLSIMRSNGVREKIAPYQIAETDNPVVDIICPRNDFRGALYQFFIGLLQKTFSPSDSEEWFGYYDCPPNVDVLKERLRSVSPAFNLVPHEGFAFMQARESIQGDILPIEDIIGGELSDNTRHKNADLFVKSGVIKVVSPYWAAVALFNMQISGVLAWGKHRVGLRGNGPLTTLSVTKDRSSLWKDCWLNVLEKEKGDLIPGDWQKNSMSDVFPWMGNTRVSPKKEPTLPMDCSPLQHYWPMPRRIHLVVEDKQAVCDLTGERLEKVVVGYKREMNGVYYTGAWLHPLSPYIANPEKGKTPGIFTGSKLSYGYRDWVGLICGDDNKGEKTTPGFMVRQSLYSRQLEGIKIWCFGYRAENAKVYGYVDKQLPGFSLEEDDMALLSQWVSSFLSIPAAFIELLYIAIAEARWGIEESDKKRNKLSIAGFKKNNEIEILYWSNTENYFYEALTKMVFAVKHERHIPISLKHEWLKMNKGMCMKTFDHYVDADDANIKQLKRMVESRSNLRGKMGKIVPVKKFSDGLYNNVEVAENEDV